MGEDGRSELAGQSSGAKYEGKYAWCLKTCSSGVILDMCVPKVTHARITYICEHWHWQLHSCTQYIRYICADVNTKSRITTDALKGCREWGYFGRRLNCEGVEEAGQTNGQRKVLSLYVTRVCASTTATVGTVSHLKGVR